MIILIISIIYYIHLKNKKHKKNVFDKIELKNLKLKNRIISAAMFDSFLEGKTISEKGIQKYENLAKNDIGIILTGGFFCKSI